MASVCLQAFVVALTAPIVWKVRASQSALLPLGTWFDGYAGSLFPFFPWAVFFLLGVIVAFGVVQVLELGRSEPRAAFGLAAGGLLAALLAYVAFIQGHVLHSWYGPHELWHTSPLYVVFRAGAVLSGLGVLWLLEPLLRRRWQRGGRFERLLTTLSHRSLVAYVAHLLVLYGTPITLGLVHGGPTLSIAQASWVSAGLIAFTIAVVLVWEHAPAWYRTRFKRAGVAP